MPATKFPAKPPGSLQRVMGVGRSVVKLDNLFPGNIYMDAIKIKFSVISLPPQPTMSSEEEVNFEGLLALHQKNCSNSWEKRWLLLMWYRQTWPVQAHRIYLEWFRPSRLWQHLLGDFFLGICEIVKSSSVNCIL